MIERDDLTLGSVMMVELWTIKTEMGDEDENDVEDTRECEQSGVPLAQLRWEDLVSLLVHYRSGLRAAASGMAN